MERQAVDRGGAAAPRGVGWPCRRASPARSAAVSPASARIDSITPVIPAADWAEREFREAVRLKPDYSAAYRELGKALVALERPEEAREIYRKGADIACEKGDLQTKKEIEVFLNRLEKQASS